MIARTAMQGHTPIRVLLTDAYPIMRIGLVATIESDPHMQVIGTAAHRQDLLLQLRSSVVDVTVINLIGLHETPIALLRAIKRAEPQVGVVVVAASVDYAPELLNAGVHAYTSYAEPDEQLYLAIKAAKVKQHYLSPLTQEYVERCSRLRSAHRLVPRELQILKYLAQGMRAREIAGALDLSDETVQNYISRIRKKTGWSSRTQMVSWYNTMYGT